MRQNKPLNHTQTLSMSRQGGLLGMISTHLHPHQQYSPRKSVEVKIVDMLDH